MNISEVFRFVFSEIGEIFRIMDSFVIEQRLGISFLDVVIFLIFADIVVFIIAFIKQFEEVKQVNENRKDEIRKSRR